MPTSYDATLKSDLADLRDYAIQLGIQRERNRVIRFLVQTGYPYSAEQIGAAKHWNPRCPNCGKFLDPTEELHGQCPTCKNPLPCDDQVDIEREGATLTPDALDLLKAEVEASDTGEDEAIERDREARCYEVKS